MMIMMVLKIKLMIKTKKLKILYNHIIVKNQMIIMMVL